MTTPPKARRYHASISESVTPGSAPQTHDPEPAATPNAAPAPKVHLEVSRKTPPQDEDERLKKFMTTNIVAA